MGKTQSGAVWLDPNKTTPFEFFQYWRNVGDNDVIKCLKMLTFLPLEEIEAMEHWEGSDLNKAKEILGYELTKLVHGQEEAEKALESSRGLFAGTGSLENMPTTELTAENFTEGTIDLITMLTLSGLADTRSDARRAVEQGGVTVDGEKMSDGRKTFTVEELSGEGKIVKRGKKKFNRIVAV